jgi:hypothetical protein
MGRIVKEIKTLPGGVIGLGLLLGLLQLGTAIEVHPQSVPSLDCNPQPVPLDLPDRPSVRELGRPQVICCPKGHVATAQGACVAAPDPCAQCSAQFSECEEKVAQGVSRCRNDERIYAINTCGNQLLHCDGSPISGYTGGCLFCNTDSMPEVPPEPWPQYHGPFPIVCYEDFGLNLPRQGMIEFTRCVGQPISECIERCMNTDAGTGKTLSVSFPGVSGGVSYTIPPNTGYNAGCIALGHQVHHECVSEKQKCQEACRPSGPSTITPGPRR